MEDFNFNDFLQKIKDKFGVEALTKGAIVAGLVAVTPALPSIIVAFVGVIWAYRKGQGK